MPSGTFLPPGITTSNVKISTGGDDNQVLTAVDGETAQGEPNLTFDGSTLTVIGAVNVGVDDTGHDVKFFGATAGSYMLWDQSEDNLIIPASGVVVGDTAQRTIVNQASEFQILGTTGADSTLTIGRWSASTGGPSLHFFKSRAGSIGTLHADSRVDTAGDTLGNITFALDDGSTDTEANAYNHYAARISGQLDAATSGVNAAPGRLVFYTTDTGVSESEAMRIDSSNKVGIGGVDPASYHANGDDLVVYSTGETGITLATNDTSSGRGAIYFNDTAHTSNMPQGHIVYTHSNDYMYFGTNSNPSSSFVLDNAQNVIFQKDITIGTGTTADRKILFDGNAIDYHIGLDDTADDLVIGYGSTLGTTPIMHISGGTAAAPLNGGMGAVNLGETGQMAGVPSYFKIRRNNAYTLTAGDYWYDMIIAPSAAVTTPSTGTANPVIATLALSEPHITNGGVQPTAAATLKINNAPTEAASNYALWVDAGVSRFDGNVGIGITPTYVTHIYGAEAGEGTALGQLAIQSSTAYGSTPDAGIIFLNEHTSGSQAIMGGIKVTKSNTGDTDLDSTMTLQVRKHGAVAFDAMTINEDGEVGIGTTPSVPFHVNSGGTNTVARFESTDTITYLQLMDNSTDTGNPAHIKTVANAISLVGGSSTAWTGGGLTVDGGVGAGRVTIGDSGNETTTEGLLYLNPETVTVGANRPYHYMYMSNNNVITIPSGTASLVTALNIEVPNISNSGTITNSATVRIAGAMTEGTANYALFVDAGVSRFDGVSLHYDGVQLGYSGTNTGEDFLAYGDTSGNYWWWDASTNKIFQNTASQVINSNSRYNLETNGGWFGLTVEGESSGWPQIGVKNTSTSATVYLMTFYDVDSLVGSITHNSSDTTAFNTTSDYRLKENEVEISDALTRVKALKPYRFNFKKAPSKTQDGFFAHEVMSLVPEAVQGTKDELYGANEPEDEGTPKHQQLDNSKLVPLLTAAIKELEARVTALGG